MSSTAMLPTLQVVIPEGSVFGPAMMVLLSSGLVGMSIKNMFDSILSDEADGNAGDADGEELTDGGGLMAEEGGDDEFGDLGGLDGDDDGMGGFGDDEFGDMDDAAGADTDELEHRLDELENEVGSLSSTVSTVRTENEQISESVDEVEENVRKLLDIYEMVTRGVNPFADDIDAGMGGGGGMEGETSFGLFDDADGEAEEEENIDDGIANADAEGFFDEELVDDEDDAMAEDDGDDMFEDDGFEDDDGSFDDDFEDGADDDGGEGGKSFQELKSEYDSGDAEWADGEAPDEELDDEADDGLDDAGFEDDELFEDDGFDDEMDDGLDEDGEDEFDEAGGFDEVGDDEFDEADPEPATTEEPVQTQTEEPVTPDETTETTEESATPDESTAAATSDETTDGKPYLASLPSTFASDLIVVEWLEFLLQQAGHREAARAIDYYETIEWVDEDVAEDLQEVLRGFDDVSASEGGLTIDHHTRSLQYISQLDDDSGEAVALSKLVGGGADGLQR